MDDNQITVTRAMRASVRCQTRLNEYEESEKVVTFNGVDAARGRNYVVTENLASQTVKIECYNNALRCRDAWELPIADFDLLVELMDKPLRRE